MSLANPLMLWWALLAIPIVVFYILKIRMRRVPVSTVMFWQQIFEEKRPRSIWQTLRHLLSLLLQLAFLALLVLALADPYFDWEILEARRIVLVVDNSASMGASDTRPTRLHEAKSRADRMIDGLRIRDEMAIIAAGTEPRVVCGLTGHQRTLRNALDALPQTDGPTRVDEAVTLGRRILAGRKNAKIVVLSDGGFKQAAELAKTGDVQWERVGGSAPNAGVTQFQVRRSLLDPLGYEILAEVVNFSDEPLETRLEIDLGRDAVDVVPLKLEPRGSWTQVFEKTSAAGGHLVARLERDDALAADNTARAILPVRERLPVVLVTEGNLFLQKVFEASPLVDLAVVKELPDLAVLPAGTVLVFHKNVPAKVPGKRVIVIDPAGATGDWQVGETLADPAVAEQDRDSPLMAHVRLDNVLMPEARQLTLGESANVLAKTVQGDPLYFVFDRPEQKIVGLTVNLDRGDLPLRTAFPILMTNALGWLSGSKGELRQSVATGAVTKIELAESDRIAHGTLLLRSPNGTTQKLPGRVNELTVGPLDQAGIWQIVPEANPEEKSAAEPAPLLEIACNLSDRDESNLSPTETLPQGDRPLHAGFGGKPIWFYLLVTAWILAGSEWFLYQRRWIE